MHDDDVRRELEAKERELALQQERARRGDDRLRGYDKTDADSFPASDPPSSMPGQQESETARERES